MDAKILVIAVLGIVGCSSQGPKEAFTTVSAADVAKNAGGNPSPKAGTKILAAIPIGRARTEMTAYTAKDPAVATLSSVGSGEDGVELHVVVENRGTCTLKSVEGVAYGFEARGASAKMNQSGAHYVAFKGDVKIEPGKKGLVSQMLKHVDIATNSVAHVDRTTCDNGTTWERK
jgi:hypothetical protein